jgi:superfamily II DNA or RNA helicase
MTQIFQGWNTVAQYLTQRAAESDKNPTRFNPGQRASLLAIAERIPKNGVVIADEVGMGKTRIAVEVANCVIKAHGRVAIVVPPGLGYQWQTELREGQTKDVSPVLRSLSKYFAVWAAEQPNDRKPWFDEPTVMVSHAFANWRLGENTEDWRWSLLPEVYTCLLKQEGSPVRHHKVSNDQRVRNAASSITEAIPKDNQHPARALSNRLLKEVDWPSLRRYSTGYSKSGDPRAWLERIVGLGLGVFDLVVIDEAHKSRGSDSGLTNLLGKIILPSSDARRLALTATPVELDVRTQWRCTLSRLGINESTLDSMQAAIEQYANAVKRVRLNWSSSQEAREDYTRSARRFQEALSPYLLRRDKREDEAVKLFHQYSGKPINAYRQEKEISVTVSGLCPQWRQAVCAAESLSFAPEHDPIVKRLRLTLGNGHCITALLYPEKNDPDQKDDGNDGTRGEDGKDITDRIGQGRARWWRDVMNRAFAKGEDELFEHPAILAAIGAIEDETNKGEKVLVFGRFTRPLRALAGLLNAREMLRRLQNNQPWPQSKLYGEKNGKAETSDWPAVRAALGQLKCSLAEDEIDETLRSNYERGRRKREGFREGLLAKVEQGLAEINPGLRIEAIFRAFKRVVQDNVSQQQEERNPLTLVSRALSEQLDNTTDEIPTSDYANAFRDVIEAVSERDDDCNDNEMAEDEAADLWETLEQRLSEDYSGPPGRFARLMYGDTKRESRQMIQLAFNRPKSFQKVLVAQSLVGREGLNLHKSCRIVVMLHPEWNPGVMEQQIGRVDRVGSRWSSQLKAAIDLGKRGDELPRIEVRPVIFRGTYDEHQWQVLTAREDDLRAQYYGVSFPSGTISADEESRKLIDEILKAAPNFSPSREGESDT